MCGEAAVEAESGSSREVGLGCLMLYLVLIFSSGGRQFSGMTALSELKHLSVTEKLFLQRTARGKGERKWQGQVYNPD